MQFRSRAFNRHLELGPGTFVYVQSPVDEFESYVWVLVWAILFHAYVHPTDSVYLENARTQMASQPAARINALDMLCEHDMPRNVTDGYTPLRASRYKVTQLLWRMHTVATELNTAWAVEVIPRKEWANEPSLPRSKRLQLLFIKYALKCVSSAVDTLYGQEARQILGLSGSGGPETERATDVFGANVQTMGSKSKQMFRVSPLDRFCH